MYNLRNSPYMQYELLKTFTHMNIVNCERVMFDINCITSV